MEDQMSTFVIIHGGGGTAAGWGLVSDALSNRGHDVVAMDLPCDDPSAGWPDYVESVVEAVGEKDALVLIAHSAGGFVAPLVCDRLPVRLIILVNAMIPVPGESFMEWWTNTGYEAQVNGPSDMLELYYHDVPHEAAVADMESEEGRGNFPSEPWPLDAWPDVPTQFVLLRDDRLFPPEFMRRVVDERLGITPDEMGGGHMVMLSRPEELAAMLSDSSK